MAERADVPKSFCKAGRDCSAGFADPADLKQPLHGEWGCRVLFNLFELV